MKFKGKFEQVIESTLVRFQQGGLLVGEVVKIKKKALTHPKVKEMGDNVKANIEMLMQTDLNLRVTAIKSIRGSIGDMSDGLGGGTTSAPTDFWVDVAVEHAPGFTSNPITLPIEVLDRVELGANLAPIPDSLKRKGNVNIKPVEVDGYDNNKGERFSLGKTNKSLSESMEDVYANMGGDNVTVRVPMEDSDEFRTQLDDAGITYSVIGTNRFELHGKMDVINNILQGTAENPETSVEIIATTDAPEQPEEAQTMSGHAVPSDSGNIGDNEEEDDEDKKNTNSIEEAYHNMITSPNVKTFRIEVANVFAENVVTYLSAENIDHETIVEGNKTLINIKSEGNPEDIKKELVSNVMGDMTYLQVYATQS